MASLTDTKTISVPAGERMTIPDGFRGLDADYLGAAAGQCFFIGSNASTNFQPQSPVVYPSPVSIPPDKPYTLEFNISGYKSVQIDNRNGTAACDVTLKY